jgi:hypothetical protein
LGRLELLPQSLLCEIIQFCNVIDHASCRRLSRAMQAAAKSPQSWATRFRLSVLEDSLNDDCRVGTYSDLPHEFQTHLAAELKCRVRAFTVAGFTRCDVLLSELAPRLQSLCHHELTCDAVL